MDTNILTKIGLTETQAKLYLTLIKNGPLSPTELSDITGETRTNAYAVAEKLISMGLARKDDSKKMIISPESPERIRNILAKKQQKIKEVNNDLSSVMPDLLSAFCLNNNINEIINVSGKEAIKIAYDSMINTNQDIFLLSNGGARYKCNQDLLEFMRSQAIRLKKAKIRTYKLIESDIYDPKKINPLRLIKPLPKEVKLDVRIMIFGNNVIFSRFFDSNIYSNIISSPEIASSLKTIFYALWNQSSINNPEQPELDIILPVK